MKVVLLFAAVAFVALAPAVSAQAGPIALTPNWVTPLSPTGPTAVPFNVTIECSLIATKGGTVNVDVALKESPTWINATPVRLPFAAADCVTGTTTTLIRAGAIQLVAADDAPGLIPFAVTLAATVVGSTESATSKKDDLMLAYRPGHTLTPAGDQIFRVTQDTYMFELVIDVTANAQTMVMFEDKTVDVGSLDGIRAMTFDVANRERSIAYNILYTPPSTNWTQATVQFRTYSHCLVGDECDPELEQTVTWTFLNEQPARPQTVDATSASTTPSGESPGVGGFVTFVLLASVVAAISRRR